MTEKNDQNEALENETLNAPAKEGMPKEGIDNALQASAEPTAEAPMIPTHVAFIDDPFGLKTLEIADAQNTNDELDLDDEELLEQEEESPESMASSEEAAAQFERLASALAEEQSKQVEDLQSIQDNAHSAAAELAKQIAEDEALAAEMARADEEAEEMDEELKAALPRADENGILDLNEVRSCIEALLFMTDKPVSAEKLQEYLGADFPLSIFQEGITALMERYKSSAHGIELVAVGGGYQFRTKPARAALAKKLAKIQTQRLSSGGMETLAIIAYRQPVMKEEIDKIRGVDSSYFIRGLMDKKLIKISGRSELPGRPMLYSTTDEFLQLFSLKALSEMPSLRELEQMVPASESQNKDEDPRVKEMRRLVNQMTTDVSVTLKYDPREDDQILREIREKVNSIPTSTPYIDEQKAAEKQALDSAKEASKQAKAASGELPFPMAEEMVQAAQNLPQNLEEQLPPPSADQASERNASH